MSPLSSLRRVLRNIVLVPITVVALTAQPIWAASVLNNTPDTDGVLLNDGDDLTNNSSITNTNVAAAVRSTTGNVVSITNAGGATITGVQNSAILIGDSGSLSSPNAANLGTFTNGGTITAGNRSFDAALNVGGNVGTFTNNGAMTATLYDTVYIHGNLTGTFTNNGTITAHTDETVRVQGTAATFLNNGTITNTDGAAAVFLNNITSFTNNHTMQGSDLGVRVSGTATSFINNDTITATGTSATDTAVNIRGTGASTVNNTGTIKGGSGLIFETTAGGSSVTNSGTIEGTAGTAIALTPNNDSLTLMTGSTTTGLVDGGAGTDTLTLDGNGAATTLAINNFSGFETFAKTDIGKWTLTGNYASAMTATESAGDLRINGNMSATNFTLNGGILGGIGTVGTIAAASGAHVAPGNSVGTLNSSSVTFASGSVFDVEIAGTTADKLAVTGTATITGGTIINVTGTPSSCGNLVLPILTTTGGLTGTFTLGSLLGSESITYDANNAYLDVTGGTGRTFTGFTNTANQASTAAALDALGCGNQPYSAAINALTDAQVPAAMDALSGEGHAAIAGALIEGSHSVSDAIDDRIAQAFNAVDGRGSLSGFAAGPMLLGDLNGAQVWGSGYGGFLSRDGNGNAAATQSAASGLVFGADGKVTEDWRLGVLGGIGLTGISSGSTNGTSIDGSIGGYAGAELGVVTIKAGAAYTRHFIDTSRSIVFPGVNDTVTASYQAGTAQAFMSFSHDFKVYGMTLTPFAKFQALNHSTDAFTETGGAGKLSTAASAANAFFLTLGVGAEDQFTLTDTMLVTARGSLGWRHAVADPLTVSNSFAGGGPFSVSAAPIAGDVAVLSAGLVFDVSDMLNVSIDYDGMIGSGLMSHAVKATAAGKF
ncbi:MAG: autotransporter domain-containing protein [Devosia sp.]